MSFLNAAHGQPGIGLSFGTLDVTCTNSSGSDLLKGALVLLDTFEQTAAVTASVQKNIFGGAGSKFRNVMIPYAVTATPAISPVLHSLFGVLLEDTANGQDGLVRFQGRVFMAITANSGATGGPGLGVYPEAGSYASPTASTAGSVDTGAAGVVGWKRLGILLEAITATSGVVFPEVLFDGIYGFK